MAADRTTDPVAELLIRTTATSGVPVVPADPSALARVVALLPAADRRGGGRR